MTDRQPRDLPLDAHMHTDLSPDSNVPIDTYAAAALERGIAEIAITDHVDFEPGAPAFAYATFADRERIVRDAAERWGPQGVQIRFGVELTYDRSWEADIRDHLARHAYDFTIGSVHDRVESPYSPAPRCRLGRGPLPGRDRGTLVRRGRGGRPVGAVRRHRPHRRREALPLPARHAGRAARRRPSCTSRSSTRSSTAARRSRSTPAGCAIRSARPFRIRRSSARFHELGGRARDRRLGRSPRRALRVGTGGRLRHRRRGRLLGAHVPPRAGRGPRGGTDAGRRGDRSPVVRSVDACHDAPGMTRRPNAMPGRSL